jgi:hypothetical protein
VALALMGLVGTADAALLPCSTPHYKNIKYKVIFSQSTVVLRGFSLIQTVHKENVVKAPLLSNCTQLLHLECRQAKCIDIHILTHCKGWAEDGKSRLARPEAPLSARDGEPCACTTALPLPLPLHALGLSVVQIRTTATTNRRRKMWGY